MRLSRKIRVLVVDDSAFFRKLALATLNADPEIEVVGTAADPYEARDKIAQLSPDVLTLDLEMPRMDGLTFLGLLMERRPIPVVVMSSLTSAGSDFALEALRLGAVDVIGKPDGSPHSGDPETQLVAKVKAAAGARLQPASPPPPRPGPERTGRRAPDPRGVILLGASTGGIAALHEVLTRLPGNLPGIAVVQHIPAVFSKTFADRLSRLCAFEVREAADGDRLAPGVALVAPGNFHLMLQWREDHYQARVTGGPPVWHQRPAIDLLFKSVAEGGVAGHCVAGVLTGMGSDGAEGLLRLRQRGATTFAQDEGTSVVYGMPRAACENGAAQSVLPLEGIAAYLRRRSEAGPHVAASPAVTRP